MTINDNLGENYKYTSFAQDLVSSIKLKSPNCIVIGMSSESLDPQKLNKLVICSCDQVTICHFLTLSIIFDGVEVFTQFAVIDNVVDHSAPLDALFTHSTDHILIIGIVVMLSQAITTLPTHIFYVLNMRSMHTWFRYYFTGVDMVPNRSHACMD